MRAIRILTIGISIIGAQWASSPAFSEITPSPSRPNIIHIMVDDMAADSMGFCGRFPFMKTPNMDKLAAAGLVFNRFFVTTSLCSPSRASILTGRYGHGTGVPDNTVHSDPDPALPTYPQLLREAGYTTAHIGKWHMGHGDQPRKGFSHWYAFDGQGVYFDPVMNRNGNREQATGYITDILTDEAIAFIHKHQDHPFALNLWHKAAHGPFKPAPRHAGMLDEVAYPKPVTWDNDLSGRPEWMRRGRVYGVHLKPWLESEGKPVPEATDARPFNKGNTAKYRNHLSTLFAVDDSLGRIMEALDSRGLLDNTIVLFTADNGFFLGEYARGDKRLQDDASIRVPMLMHYPGQGGAGKTISAISLNIDFAPTILDLAGVAIPDTIQGKSLRPIIDGKTDKVRAHFLYEYFQEEYAPGVPTILALRTDRWKYVRYPYEAEAGDELFDLNSDPHEAHSLASDPEYSDILGCLRQTMEAEMKALDFRPPSYQYDPENYAKTAP